MHALACVVVHVATLAFNGAGADHSGFAEVHRLRTLGPAPRARRRLLRRLRPLRAHAQQDGAPPRVTLCARAHRHVSPTRASTWQVREAQLAQYNFILVVGSSEEEADSVNVRTRDNEVHGSKTVSDFVAELKDRVAKHE